MNNQLKPCPFCGGDPVLKQYREDGLEIKCSSCYSGRQQRWMYKGRDWLEVKMIEKWNERTTVPAPVAVALPTLEDFNVEVENIFGFPPSQLCLLNGEDMKLVWLACIENVKDLNQ